MTALATAPLEVIGRVVDSSNVALLARLDARTVDRGEMHAIYKPISGERPLWDFPDGQLAFREVGAYVVAQAGGWAHIPPTVLRVEAPFGPGSMQLWVTPVPGAPDAVPRARHGDRDGAQTEDDAIDPETGVACEEDDEGLVLVTDDGAPAHVRLWPMGQVPRGWHAVVRGEDYSGRQVVLAHSNAPVLRSIAVLDAVLNNSDRKGSHLLSGLDGRTHCIDHGLTLHHEDKLRTVLWGWAGQPLPESQTSRLRRLRERLDGSADADLLAELLSDAEVESLKGRVERLLRTGRHPRPSSDWPSVPWPPL